MTKYYYSNHHLTIKSAQKSLSVFLKHLSYSALEKLAAICTSPAQLERRSYHLVVSVYFSIPAMGEFYFLLRVATVKLNRLD